MEATSSDSAVPDGQELASATLHFLQVQEAERSHLARELHDQVGQILTLISLTLCDVKRLAAGANWVQLEECCQMVDGAIDQVRSLSLNLRPPLLDELGLEAAVRWLSTRQVARAGLEVHFDCAESLERMHPDLEITAFRVVQESLTNVLRHAQAQRIWVRLTVRDGQLAISIQDDGVGFEVEANRQRATRGDHFGLLSMRQRAALVGGSLEIRSVPSRGTVVRARFPLHPCCDTAANTAGSERPR